MDLAKLERTKQWIGVVTNDDDVMLSRLIAQLSQGLLNEISRPALTRKTYTELRNGVGNQQMTLRNWPVIGVTSLNVGGTVVPARTSLTSSGYVIEDWDGTTAGIPQEILLSGYTFARGKANVQIVYDAGYCIEDEAATVPATILKVTAQQPYGTWAEDDGVTYASTGAALAAVTGTPTTGQYRVQAGVYEFAAGDANAGILISYSFIPRPLEQACMEWVGERYRYRDRIGQTSKSLGGNETAAYSLKGIPDFIADMINPYRKFLPL